MAADRQNIYPNDTLPVAYECRKPDPLDPIGNDRGLPATPATATVKCINQDGEWLELGGVGITEVDMDITPETGDTTYDRGAIIKYTLPAVFTQSEGNYTLFCRAVFPDGSILTEDKKFRVVEYR